MQSRNTHLVLLALGLLPVRPLLAPPGSTGVAAVKVFVEVVQDGASPPVAPSSFLVDITRAGVNPNPVSGSATGRLFTVPINSSVEAAVRVTQQATGGVGSHVPVFTGDCDAQGNLTLGIGRMHTCRITNYFPSRGVANGNAILRVIFETDPASAAAEIASHQIRVQNPATGFDITAAASATPTMFGLLVGSGHQLFVTALRTVPSTLFPTYSGDCEPGGRVALIPGQKKDCLVTLTEVNSTNAPTGHGVIKIIKQVVDPNGQYSPQNFTILLTRLPNTNAGSVPGDAQGRSLTALGGTSASPELYLLSETFLGGPSPLVATRNPNGSVSLRPGEKKVVTVSNIRPSMQETNADAILALTKIVEGSGAAPSSFTLDIRDAQFNILFSVPGPAGGASIGLRGRGAPHPGAPPPPFRVTETPPAGFVPIFSEDCAGGADFTVLAGDMKRCTVTNIFVPPGLRIGTPNSILTVIHQVDSTGDSQPRNFSLRVRNIETNASVEFPATATAANVGVEVPLGAPSAPGQAFYNVEVNVDGAGAGQSGYATSFSGDCAGGGGVLPRGQRHICTALSTFVGADPGNSYGLLRVVKRIEDSSGSAAPPFTIRVERLSGQQVAEFPGTAAGRLVVVPFSLAQGPTVRVREPDPGSYFPFYSGDCDAGGDVDVPRGEMRTCIVTNLKSDRHLANRAPLANGGSVNTNEDTPVNIQLTASDPDGDALTFQVTTPPAHGQLSGTAPNLVYTPAPNYNGPDSLTFRALDAEFSSTATISINVAAVNDPPVASNSTHKVPAGSPFSFNLVGSDVDSPALIFEILSQPSQGTLSAGTGAARTYTPANGFAGADSFTYRVSDGVATSPTAVVTLNVVNQLRMDAVTVVEGSGAGRTMNFLVRLGTTSKERVTVNYRTVNDVALSAQDFTSATGTLSFAPGVTTATIPVNTVGDYLHEPDERFFVDLSSVTAGIEIATPRAVGLILNDDPVVGSASGAGPAQVIVGQQFLYRVTWVSPTRWRDLRFLDFRLIDDAGEALRVRFSEPDNTFAWLGGNDQYGSPGLPGDPNQLLFNEFGYMTLRNSAVQGSGPTGPSATFTYALTLEHRTIGRTLRAEVFLTDDASQEQGWIPVGAVQVLASPTPATVWIGLKNGDDLGTQFDLRAELYKNGTLVSSGQTPCVGSVIRNADEAKEVGIPLGPLAGAVASGDVLSLKVLARMGTNPDGTKCPGHANATGLRLYYDSTNRPARFTSEIAPHPLRDYFLHTTNGAHFFDTTPPGAASPKFLDSGAIIFANGNPWKEIGTWTRTQP